MATKNKKDIKADLLANIYTNTTKDIKAIMVQTVINDFTNSMSVNITVAQLRLEDDSSEHSLANILDANKQGVFYYDAADNTSADDGGGMFIVTATGKRYRRKIGVTVDARWFGFANYYFDSVADALSNVKPNTRFVGLEIAALINGNVTILWFVAGVADGNLVTKSVTTQVWDFTVGDGGFFTPVDGATEAINPDLFERIIIGFWIGANKIKVVTYPATLARDDTYGQFNPALSKMVLLNGTYVDTTDYLIMYK